MDEALGTHGVKQMEFHVQGRTYDSSGGSAIYSIVGDQLMLGLGDYGTAIKAMEITIFHRSTTTNPRRDLQQLFDRYHEYLKRLPTITFRRKLNRVEIDFVKPVGTIHRRQFFH